MEKSLILAPHVFLTLDDLSRAGKHVLRFARMKGAQASPLPQSIVEKLVPVDLIPFVQIYQWPDNEVAAIVVNTSIVHETQRWELAEALVSALSQADVQQLTIIAAMHLPYAKDNALNVFYSDLNVGEDWKADVAMLPQADRSWELKDPWLSAFLHFISVEQWPRTHLLLAKGYKPGRDLSGTYEAVNHLSQAIEIYTKGKMTFDVLEVQRNLPRLLAEEKTVATAGNDYYTLLYQ
ncbi:uncharacterized protein PHALS_07457 [Plasmopara halstedii]|uniref:Uncharacterized protein n=1 Tax=Plasmopara halstedii TaxID=4781 RepID=A0A0P1B5K6_PLAHL|nr:uncharacterized protein PHALS_07457 [Plasmopara halstedii]CEG49705.1 hypothetical protein PHALS_07457 [Plasmopara halstedii]|eukprot:XP_024586074.1 hypothetical protein PHALS_07457 [Plasmopara halstedii]